MKRKPSIPGNTQMAAPTGYEAFSGYGSRPDSFGVGVSTSNRYSAKNLAYRGTQAVAAKKATSNATKTFEQTDEDT